MTQAAKTFDLQAEVDEKQLERRFLKKKKKVRKCSTAGDLAARVLLPRHTGMQPHLLYVFRMISNTARMTMMPTTMTAIIAPEPV